MKDKLLALPDETNSRLLKIEQWAMLQRSVSLSTYLKLMSSNINKPTPELKLQAFFFKSYALSVSYTYNHQEICSVEKYVLFLFFIQDCQSEKKSVPVLSFFFFFLIFFFFFCVCVC